MCVQLLKMFERNILIHAILFFIKWHIYEKKKPVESACQKTETIQSCNIYSFQTCDTFTKNSWNMLDRKKFNLTLLSVKCNVGKAVEKAWKKMKWIPTFENLWLSTVKHTRQWLRDTDSLSVYTTHHSYRLFGFKAFANNILHH